MDKQSNKARFKQCSYIFNSDQVSTALSKLGYKYIRGLLGLLAAVLLEVWVFPTNSRLSGSSGQWQ